jgi:hypothetical protein
MGESRDDWSVLHNCACIIFIFFSHFFFFFFLLFLLTFSVLHNQQQVWANMSKDGGGEVRVFYR